jgi:uncharacterized OB-fold protein
MQNVKCPKCGRETVSESSCPDCGNSAVNGFTEKRWIKPPPPPEVASWVIEPVPPELAEEFRRTFDEAAFVAEMEETLATGGVRFEDIVAKIERKLYGRD